MQLETTTHPEKTAASLAAEIEQRRDRLATLQREQSEVRGAADSARAARVTAILNGSKPGSASTIATLVEQWSSVGEAIEVISGEIRALEAAHEQAQNREQKEEARLRFVAERAEVDALRTRLRTFIEREFLPVFERYGYGNAHIYSAGLSQVGRVIEDYFTRDPVQARERESERWRAEEARRLERHEEQQRAEAERREWMAIPVAERNRITALQLGVVGPIHTNFAPAEEHAPPITETTYVSRRGRI